jgi:hypothetical protein
MSHANAALTPRPRLRVARLVVRQGWPETDRAACGLPAYLASAAGSWPRELRLSQGRGRRPVVSGVGQKPSWGSFIRTEAAGIQWCGG